MTASSMNKRGWRRVLLGAMVMLLGLFSPGLARANNLLVYKDFNFQVPQDWTLTINQLADKGLSFQVPLGWTTTLKLLADRGPFFSVPLRLTARGDLRVPARTTYTVSRDINYNNEYVMGTMLQSQRDNLTNSLYVDNDSPSPVSPSPGTYDLSGGSLKAVNEEIGGHYRGGRGGIFKQSGGTNTVSEFLEIGGSNSSGTYDLSGGSLSAKTILLKPGGNFSQSNGTLDFFAIEQTGGSATFTGANLYLGRKDWGSEGYYYLDGGSLTVSEKGVGTGLEYIGYNGVGGFYQTGGSNTTKRLFLGFNPGSIGTYYLDGDGRLSADVERIGEYGTGTFTQKGGSNTAEIGFSLGVFAGSHGTYNLRGTGSLTTWTNELIGINGVGVFNQGGNNTHVAYDGIFLGFSKGGDGTYFIDSGTLKAADTTYSPNGIYVGYNGIGRFSQRGGTTTVSDLYLGFNTGGSGTCYLNDDGRLSAVAEYIGYNGTGTFTQEGGSHTVAHTLTLAANPGSRGTYNFNGGALSAGAIQINNGGTFSVKDVSNAVKVSGDVTNSGKVNTTNTKVTWNNTFNNNGAYISDRSTQTFKQDLVVGSNGYLVGQHSQDLFIFTSNFQNNSTQSAAWNTAAAEMQFVTGASNSHTLFIAGDGSAAGHPFAWNTLDITGQTLHLKDGDATAGGALWLQVLTGAKMSGTALTNIFNDDLNNVLNLYYDKNLTANGYLDGRNYTITGGAGGMLIAHTPVPPSVLLLGSGLLGMGLLGWRRKRGLS
jgi:hypothetical protein